MERTQIKKVLDYIEEHLKDDRKGVLDNASLAKVAGYSEYHFLRLFRKYVHLTPADYIRKRRISEIVRQIGSTDRPMSDIAFEYGFNSKENFTRAFKAEHRMLPTEFRAANCSLRLFAPFEFDPVIHLPEVSIGYLDGFSLTVYPFDEEEPPDCWNRYNAEGRSARLSGGSVAEDYGVMEWNPVKGRLDYCIGIRTDETAGDTAGTVEIKIPGGLYAIFVTSPASQHDFITIVRQTWDWIYGVWLPENGYSGGGGYEFECYVESSRKYSEKIYVPLVRDQEYKEKERQGNENG